MKPSSLTNRFRMVLGKMRLIIAICLLMGIGSELSAKKVFLSSTGNDKGKGTLEQPFKTVKRAMRVLSAGDTCFFRGGVYTDKISILNFRGEKEKPLVFMPWNGEQVQFNGTIPIKGKWVKQSDKVYRLQLNEDVWQLFSGDAMLTAARWPNANMDDPNFWNQKYTYRKMSPESSFGKTVDERPKSGLSETGKTAEDEGALERGVVLPDDVNVESLAETQRSMKGCIAIMNMGSWMTWAQFIDEHKAGSNEFTYDQDFSYQDEHPSWGKTVNIWCRNKAFWEQKNTKHGQGHYFIEGLQCLDQPGEWWYDHKSKMLYLIPEEGKTPEEMNLYGKRMTYALEIRNSNSIVFDGFQFFGATLKCEISKNISICNTAFQYPSYSRRVLGELGRVPCTYFKNKSNKIASNNKVVNCTFQYFDGSALAMVHGNGDTIDNVLIHDGDYSCVGRALNVNIETSTNTFIRRVTMYNTGSSQSIKMGDGSRATLCNFYNVGVFQSDGSPLQAGFFKSMEFDHNWSHDNRKHAFRFDGHGGPPVPYSTNGTIHHNVAWNTGRYQIKGDQQLVFNNTSWDSPGMCMLLWEKMNGYHTKSIAMNNLVTVFSTRWWGKKHPAFPGKLGKNVVGEIEPLLRDPRNGDFRPRVNDSICNTGSFELATDHPAFDKEHFVVEDKQPDMGAYEANCKNYWIPGYQFQHASTPIPYSNGVAVKNNADLMWLFGREALKSHVYLGASKAKVEKAGKKSKLYQGAFENNIFTPSELEKGQTYYWRVDSETSKGTVKGEVWKFTVEK